MVNKHIFARIFSFCLVVLLLSNSMLASAAPQRSEYELRKLGIYFVASEASEAVCSPNPSTGAAGGGAAVLPTGVPEPYNRLISTASQKFNADPRLVAAAFWVENRGFPIPVPTNWPSSDAGASGPMQFMPRTWAGYQEDGNGDGVKDINNVDDAIFAGAKFISALGGKPGIPLGDLNYPLKEGTMLRVAAAYNWGPGNVSKAGVDRSLASLNDETENYVKMVHQLISSDFTSFPAGGRTPATTNQATTTPGTEGRDVNSGFCATGASRQRIIQVAQDELTKWESGELKPGDGYLKYSNNTRTNWCAYFVSWIYAQAGSPLKPADDGRVALVDEIKHIGIRNGRYHDLASEPTYVPRPGDIAIRQNGEDHVNLVISVNGDRMTTIGGNQGATNQQGDSYETSKVTSYTSAIRDAAITGFVSPD